MDTVDINETHFTRVLPRTIYVIIASLLAYVALLAWIFYTIPSADTAVMQAIAALIIVFSCYVAGNTYRLRDVRRRQAYRISLIQSDDIEARQEAWAQLVPPTTISFRYRTALTGILFGALGQASIILMFALNDDLVTGIIATFLVTILAGLIFLAGTFSRPID